MAKDNSNIQFKYSHDPFEKLIIKSDKKTPMQLRHKILQTFTDFTITLYSFALHT